MISVEIFFIFGSENQIGCSVALIALFSFPWRCGGNRVSGSSPLDIDNLQGQKHIRYKEEYFLLVTR